MIPVVHQGPASIQLCTTPASWIEGETVRQLEAVARWPGMQSVVGFPDVQPGKGSPSGAAFLSSSLYPALIGSDIGCGIGLWRLEGRVRSDRAERLLQGLEDPWEGDTAQWQDEQGMSDPKAHPSMGTLGGGNHFAEVLVDPSDPTAGPYLMVHTGSRALGDALWWDIAARFGSKALPEAAAWAYLADHDRLVAWARANRALVAKRLSDRLHVRATRVLDIGHNLVQRRPEGWLHRKGAAMADQGPVALPGSRGAYSYLVDPVSKPEMLWSLAHGAGRKWTRDAAMSRMKDASNAVLQPRIDGHATVVLCTDRALLRAEAPKAYKDIEQVVADLDHWGIIQTRTRLRPILTFKTLRKTERER